MKINWKVLFTLFSLIMLCLYAFSVTESIVFSVLTILLLGLFLGLTTFVVLRNRDKRIVFIVIVIILNIWLSYLTVTDSVWWTDISRIVTFSAYLLLLYTVTLIKYEKPNNLIYTIAITSSFALLPITMYLHYNSHFNEWGVYGGMQWIYVAQIVLLGIVTIVIQIYLDKLHNKTISLITQILLQASVVAIMLNILYWAFYSDGI